VIGKAKVMSYEDIKEAREKRAAKEAAKASGKRGRSRPRKSALPAAGPKVIRTQRSEAEVAAEEVAALGLGDYCSVLQFSPGSEEIEAAVIA
jgi:sRNA-binding protein